MPSCGTTRALRTLLGTFPHRVLPGCHEICEMIEALEGISRVHIMCPADTVLTGTQGCVLRPSIDLCIGRRRAT